MKMTEYSKNELMNMRVMFDGRKLYSLRDKSENQQFEEGDLCVLRFKLRETVYNEYKRQYDFDKSVTHTIIVSFISKTQWNGYIEYKLREPNGNTFTMSDYTTGFGLYHLKISKEFYESEWKKFKKAEEEKRLAEEAAEKERLRIKKEEEAKKMEEEWLLEKQREEEAARMLQMENERRSQTMTITVGEYEDLVSKLEELSSRISYVEDNMVYRHRWEEE